MPIFYSLSKGKKRKMVDMKVEAEEEEEDEGPPTGYKWDKPEPKRKSETENGNRAVRIRQLQESHREEVGALRAEIQRLKTTIANHESLQAKWMTHSKR